MRSLSFMVVDNEFNIHLVGVSNSSFARVGWWAQLEKCDLFLVFLVIASIGRMKIRLLVKFVNLFWMLHGQWVHGVSSEQISIDISVVILRSRFVNWVLIKWRNELSLQCSFSFVFCLWKWFIVLKEVFRTFPCFVTVEIFLVGCLMIGQRCYLILFYLVSVWRPSAWWQSEIFERELFNRWEGQQQIAVVDCWSGSTIGI